MADKKSSVVIGGGRMVGKTTKLIKRASEEHLYILCPNKNMSRVIANQAKDMGLDIPYPITVDDLPLHSTHIDEILIDEVEMVLQQLIGKRIAGMSTSYRMEELPSLRDKQKTKKTISAGTMTVDVDVSDALKGLKAVQREARKAIAALKELEAQQDKMAYLPIRPEVSE